MSNQKVKKEKKCQLRDEKKTQRPTHRSDENVHTTQLTRDQRNKKENPREWVEIGGRRRWEEHQAIRTRSDESPEKKNFWTRHSLPVYKWYVWIIKTADYTSPRTRWPIESVFSRRWPAHFLFFKCQISNLITRCWSPCSLSTRLLGVEKNDYIIMSSVISKRLTISCGDIRLFESVFLRVFQVIQQQIILVSYRGHLSRPNDVAVDAIVPIRLAGKRRRIVLGSRNLKSSFLLTARTDGGRPKRFHYTTITCCRWLKGKSANGGHCQRMQSVVRDDYTLTMGDRLVAQVPLLTINRNGQWARHKYRIDLIDSRRSKKKRRAKWLVGTKGEKIKSFVFITLLWLLWGWRAR